MRPKSAEETQARRASKGHGIVPMVAYSEQSFGHSFGSPAQRRQPPWRLRLVVVPGGRQPWYLVTSVLDPRRLSDQAVAEIYRRRWRIELFFRHFKQTDGRSKLRSQIQRGTKEQRQRAKE